MPTFVDIQRFFACQAFGKTTLPNVNLSGRTIVVTGGNTGLGLDAAKHLARKNISHLILGCRNLKKGEAARAAIYETTKCKGRTTIDVWEVDLDRYESVKAFSHRVCSELERLDGFVANAGVELTKFEKSEGLEKTLNTNVVSTFLMAAEVLPKLQETAATYKVDTRLSFTGSLIHYFGPDNQLEVPESQEILISLSDPKTADMAQRYNLSKLVEHQVFMEFVRRVPASAGKNQVIVNLINPGWCGTELSRNKKASLFERVFFSLIGRTSEEGSRTLVDAVTAGPETHGQYLSECVVKPQSSYMRSERAKQIGQKLWDETVRRIERADPEAAKGLGR